MSMLDTLTITPYRQRVNNWSNTHACYPQLIFEPTNVEEVQLIVNEARRQNKRIRPVGKHTSPGEGFLAKDWMIKTRHLNYTDIDSNARTATIGSGLSVREVNKILYDNGLSFPTVGSIDEISVGGLFCAAVHGSSISNPSTSDKAIACTLVTADGRASRLRRDSSDQEEADLFKATGCGSGATGIVVDITFELEVAFGLAPIYEKICIRDILAKGRGKGGLVDVAKQNEFVKIWYFPNTTAPQSHEADAIIWRADRCKPPPYPAPPSYGEEVQKKAIHILHGIGVFLCTYIFTSFMPYFNGLLAYLQSRGLPMQQNPIPGALAQLMDCMYWQLVQEWAIPITKDDNWGAIQALRDLLAVLDNDKVIGGGLTAPFEIRFSKTASTYWLSPLAQQDVEALVWLEPIVYRPLNLAVPARYDRLFEVLDTIGRKYGGRPHMAKPRRVSSQKELHQLYPDIDKWNATVRAVDPEGVFWSDWLEVQFGVKAPVVGSDIP